ncbi:MAG: DUF1569 domain-containing protein [Ferruginibacter sp.]
MKSLFENNAYEEVVRRVNALTPQSQGQWGKMNVSQMMAHCCNQIETAFGDKKLKPNFILGLIGPLLKKKLYEDKPFTKSLPTDKSFIVADERDFEKEKSRLLNLIKRFYEDKGTLIGSKKHPFFGNLSKEQWAMGTYKHLDHHLQQFGG